MMGVAVVFYIIGIIACLLLNLLVIIVLGSKRRELNLLDLIIISLAISDFLQAGIGYPVEIYSLSNKEEISYTACKIAGFSVTFFALVSISHLVGIAIERCVILKNPWKAREWSENPILSLYVIIPSWIYGFAWALMPLLGWSSYEREQDAEHRCSIDVTKRDSNAKSYSYSILVSCFVVPVGIIVVCCVFIQRELRLIQSQGTTLRIGDNATLLRRKMERKQSIMAFVLIGTFLVAWSPYAACVFMLTFKGEVSHSLLSFSAIFAKTSTLYNPIIYSILMKEFRVRFKQLLGIRSNVVFPVEAAVKVTSSGIT